jgi:Spy/CpxP family protein refolding chaperone
MMKTKFFGITALLLSTVLPSASIFATASTNSDSPYKGQQHRSIKALSQNEINGYLNGKGMGFAKAAELNHYPGPRHVLDLSEKLELSASQIKQTESLFDKMQAKAIILGKQLVDHEQKLDQLFAQGSVDKNSLDAILQNIGTIQAKLRGVHLSTHLEQKQLLNKHQVMMYDRLRGYGDNGSHDSNHHHSH